MNNQEKQEYIKSKIISAIMELLTSKKLEDIKADEIADRADVSKRTLYKYYSSKKEMYLALVMQSFMELSEKIYAALKKNNEDDPWYQIECIGREYMRYCMNDTVKAKLILGYDEMEYISEFPKWVADIQKFSNQFELVPFINEYYEYHNIKPSAEIESLALYLWAEAQGMAALLLSKRQWIKEYYKLDETQLIDAHLTLSKRVLGEKE